MNLLARHSWPGNVRELENVIEGLFAMGVAGTVSARDLPAHLVRPADLRRASGPEGDEGVTTLKEAERELLVRALRSSRSNKAEAARKLGISRQRLYRMVREHGIRD